MVHEEHSENLRELLQQLIDGGDVGGAMSLLLNRHPADQADLIEQLDEEPQELVVKALRPEQLAEVLEYLNEDLRWDLLTEMAPAELAPVLDRLDEDVAADIVQDLEPEQAEQVVPLLEDRAVVEELLSYPAESAGGRMSTDVVALRRDWTVEEAIWFLRRQQPNSEQPFYLYVVDRARRLTGIVSLRALITSAPFVHIESIMREDVITVRVDEDQEVVAERMRHYNLLALPVVDAEGRLRGVISADDILDVQVEEATEDMFHLAGLNDEERIFRPINEAVPPRLAWLSFNLCTAFVAALIVHSFEGTIDRVAALAVFMPMVAGMAGNAGLQTLTLVVRSLALGEIEPRDARRVLKHEAIIAAINGVLIGIFVGIVAWIWKGSGWLGFIVGAALIANIANAMLAGVLVPMLLKRFKSDPALASGVIVMFADAWGLLFFLGLGTLLVTQLGG
jgi:magnesium transporter